jgi:hypothetical protein
MSCSHTEECPLFPLLNNSLRSWRNCYCDSEDGWRDCARYKLSLTGRRVPITLLPNGHSAAHLGGGIDVGGCGSSAPPEFGGVPTAVLAPTAPTAALAPARRLEPAAPVAAPPVAAGPIPLPRAPVEVARPAHRSPGRAHRLWFRLLDWMRSPA